MASLKDYSIKNILAIDDVFYQIDGNTEISLLDEEMVTIFDEINDFNGYFSEFVNENSDQHLSDFFEEFGLDDNSAKMMLDVINERSKSSYTELSHLPGVEFIDCVPEVEKINKILDSLMKEDKKTLIILDRKLAGSDEMAGRSKLGSILSNLSSYLKRNGNFFLIMYSSEPKYFSSYGATVDYLMSDLYLNEEVIKEVALHINFLTKNMTSEAEVIDVLRKSQKANYVNSFNEIFIDSMSSLRDRIWDLSHNESLFHYDYLVEGQQIDQIIFNIFLDKFRTSYMKHMDRNFTQLINPMRNSIQKYERSRVLEEVNEADKVPAKYRFIKEVNTSIHGGSNTTSVFPSDDISFGDIIRIADSNYIVVSQNCDMTIRYDGERALQTFQLIKITEKEETINAQWLVSFLMDYADGYRPKIKLNEKGSEYFKNTFFNPLSDTELQLMGFEKKCLKEIEEALEEHGVRKALNKLDFQGYDKDLGICYQYKIDTHSQEIYTVPCFWLDSLLLRKNNNEYIITMDSIESSKEIRYATKVRIKNDFEQMIEKFNLLSKEGLMTAFENNLFNPLVNVEPLFDSNEKLYGFKLLNISRLKKMKPHVARKIHLEMISKQTREAVNESIPI